MLPSSPPLKAILVDDEKRSLDNLSQLLTKYCADTISICSLCRTIPDAYKAITRHQPDIVFLDVDMPPHTGFDLLKKYDELPFEVIFVTAYDFYAIDAIKFSAAYYILKPVKIEELREAIQKARKVRVKHNQWSSAYFHQLDLKDYSRPMLLVKSLRKSTMVALSDITFLEAEGSYTNIHTNTGTVVTCSQRNLKEYETMLSDKGFFRAHKSFLVAIREVRELDKTDGYTLILRDNTVIPLAHRKKLCFERIISL